MPDPNFQTVNNWAMELSTINELPENLVSVDQRIRVIEVVSKHIQKPGEDLAQISKEEKEARMDAIGEEMVLLIPRYADKNERISIALRIWEGYLAAAKALSPATMNGTNSVEMREAQFRDIDHTSASDFIFKAGVSVAPIYKIRIKEPICFDGVPSTSAIWER